MGPRSRLVWPFLVAVALVAAACGGAADDGGTFIVCDPPDDTTTLLVAHPGGGTPRTITGGPFGPPVWAAPQDGTVLYRSLDDEWFLVTAAEAAARSLDLASDDYPHRVVPSPASAPMERWLVLTGQERPHALVDLATGELVDLSAALPGATEIMAVDFDTAGSNVLLLDSSWRWWLLPTADPLRAQAIGASPTQADLADDGTRLVYVEDGQVFLGALTDFQAHPEAGEAQAARFVEGGLLVMATESISFYDPAGRRSEVLWQGARAISSLVAGDGSAAVVQLVDADFEPAGYLHVDITGRRVTEMALDTMKPGYAGPDRVLLWTLEGDAGSPPVAVAATVVDLHDGSATALDLPEEGLTPDSLWVGPDGRYALIHGGAGDTDWLLSLETGSLTRLPGAGFRGIAFSPDGSKIVAAVSDGADPAAWDLVVFNAAAPGQGTSLGVSCISPVWVAAPPD